MPSVRSACVALVGMGAAHAMYSYNHPGGRVPKRGSDSDSDADIPCADPGCGHPIACAGPMDVACAAPDAYNFAVSHSPSDSPVPAKNPLPMAFLGQDPSGEAQDCPGCAVGHSHSPPPSPSLGLPAVAVAVSPTGSFHSLWADMQVGSTSGNKFPAFSSSTIDPAAVLQKGLAESLAPAARDFLKWIGQVLRKVRKPKDQQNVTALAQRFKITEKEADDIITTVVDVANCVGGGDGSGACRKLEKLMEGSWYSDMAKTFLKMFETQIIPDVAKTPLKKVAPLVAAMRKELGWGTDEQFAWTLGSVGAGLGHALLSKGVVGEFLTIWAPLVNNGVQILSDDDELGDALRKTAGMKGLSLVRTCESSLTYSLDNLDVKKHLGVTHSADPKLTCNRLLFLGSVALLEGVILNNPGMLPGKLPSNPGGMMMGMGGGGPPAMFGGNKKFGGGGGDFIAVQWNGPVKHSKPAVLVAGIQEFKREWGDKLEQGKLISFVWEQLEKMLNSVPGAGMVINRGDLEFLRDVLYEVEKMARRIIAFETEDNSAEMLKRSLVSDNYDPQLSEAIADLWVNTIAKKVAADPDAGKKSTTEEVTSSSPSERDTHRESNTLVVVLIIVGAVVLLVAVVLLLFCCCRTGAGEEVAGTETQQSQQSTYQQPSYQQQSYPQQPYPQQPYQPQPYQQPPQQDVYGAVGQQAV